MSSNKRLQNTQSVLDFKHISTIERAFCAKNENEKQDLISRKQSFIHLKEGVSFKISHPSTLESLTRHNYPPQLRKNYLHSQTHPSMPFISITQFAIKHARIDFVGPSSLTRAPHFEKERNISRIF
jgi:hypothetical protein